MNRLIVAGVLALAVPVVPVEASAGNVIVTEWCDPAPCLESQGWGPTRSQWIEGVTRLHPRISNSQAAAIWEMPNKWWRNHLAWQRKITNWSTINPAVIDGETICSVTTRNSGRNGWGERLVAVYHNKEWISDHSWDVELIGYNTWSEITDVGGAYHLADWVTVEDWWSTRGGTGSLHSFHGSRRTGTFTSISIPILGFSLSHNLSVYMGAYFDATVETGNNDRESCYTID